MTTAVQTASAVGYFRVSSAGQAGERHVSLEVQQAAFQDYCRANHLNPSATFTDVASGRKDDRREYRRMLEHVAQEGVGNVVVLFLDRFGRNPREILRRYWELQERGTTVQSVNEDLREELLLLVRAGIAGQESKRTSERVRLALREAATRGRFIMKLPFGYAKIKDLDGERIVQVPREAEAVRLAYELATARNLGYKAMADELNQLGYRTKVGAFFAAQSLKLILLNPAMAGNPVFHGQGGEPIVNEGAYPAILNPEEWAKLQERLAIRRSGRHRSTTATSPYLLSGVLRCGHCGGAMSGENKGKHRYYSCTGRKMAGALCSEARSHRQAELETAILEHLGQYVDPARVRELLDAQGDESDNRDEQELARVTARLGELEQGFLNDLDRVDRGILDEPEYVKRQESRRAEQVTLQSRKADLESSVADKRATDAQSAAVPLKIGSFLEDFGGMDVPQAKVILQGIVKAAHVFNDGRIELEFRG